MKTINLKPNIIIILTLIIGFLLGIITTGIYTRYRIDELLQLNTKEGLKSKYLKVLDPTELQSKEIDSLIGDFADKNSQLLADYQDSLNALKMELQAKLTPKLNPSQIKKMENAPGLKGKVEKKSTTTKGLAPLKNWRRDSISAILIDSLKSRQKEIRKVNRIQNSDLQEANRKFKEYLQLTDSQFVLINAINLKYVKKFKSIQSDTLTNGAEKLKELRTLRAEMHKLVKPILTVEQFEKYKKVERARFQQREK